jgi:tetratricopeptide (TPR) repeat protein
MVFIEFIALEEEKYGALRLHKTNSRNSRNLAKPMSYINEALKKAQREKDALSARYTGFLAARKERTKALRRRSLWWTSLIAVLILLAFMGYTWLDSKGTETQSASKDLGPQTVLKQASVLDPKDLYDRARRFQKTGRSREARRLYQRAREIDPDNVHVVNNIGVTFLQERNFTDARKSFLDAIQQQPDYVDPYYNLACLHAIQGEVEKGLDYLRKAVSLDESVRQWARKDGDLKGLRSLPGFEEVVGKR